MKKYYPLMLSIENKPCTVIGGGQVAERKILSLLEHGAVVTVISPEITDEIERLVESAKVKLIKRQYITGDLAGSLLVYVATDNIEVSRGCHQEAMLAGIMINVVDVPELCDFIVPATIKRGDLTICVSTNGKSPMLARSLREELEEQYGDEYKEYLDTLGEIRSLAMQEINDINLRKRLFHTLVYDNDIRQVLTYKSKDLKEKLMEVYEKFKKDKGVS